MNTGWAFLTVLIIFVVVASFGSLMTEQHHTVEQLGVTNEVNRQLAKKFNDEHDALRNSQALVSDLENKLNTCKAAGAQSNVAPSNDSAKPIAEDSSSRMAGLKLATAVPLGMAVLTTVGYGGYGLLRRKSHHTRDNRIAVYMTRGQLDEYIQWQRQTTNVYKRY